MIRVLLFHEVLYLRQCPASVVVHFQRLSVHTCTVDPLHVCVCVCVCVCVRAWDDRYVIECASMRQFLVCTSSR